MTVETQVSLSFTHEQLDWLRQVVRDAFTDESQHAREFEENFGRTRSPRTAQRCAELRARVAVAESVLDLTCGE